METGSFFFTISQKGLISDLSLELYSKDKKHKTEKLNFEPSKNFKLGERLFSRSESYLIEKPSQFFESKQEVNNQY